jgi:hypothetical protein
MAAIIAYTRCKACASTEYSETFEYLDKITSSITRQNVTEIIIKTEEIAQTCGLENHAIFFRFKFEDPENRDKYWQAVKVKARNPESVVNTLSKSRVVAEHEFWIRREVVLKEDPTNAPRGENVFIDEENESVLFVVKPPDGFSIATNRIVVLSDGLYYQGAYFYLRHRNPLSENILSIHRSVFENIQSKVVDGTMGKLYAFFYTNPLVKGKKKHEIITRIRSYLTTDDLAKIACVSKYFFMKALL